MKIRLLALLLASALCVGLAGCGKKDDEGSANGENTKTTENGQPVEENHYLIVVDEFGKIYLAMDSDAVVYLESLEALADFTDKKISRAQLSEFLEEKKAYFEERYENSEEYVASDELCYALEETNISESEFEAMGNYVVFELEQYINSIDSWISYLEEDCEDAEIIPYIEFQHEYYTELFDVNKEANFYATNATFGDWSDENVQLLLGEMSKCKIYSGDGFEWIKGADEAAKYQEEEVGKKYDELNDMLSDRLIELEKSIEELEKQVDGE